MHVSPPHTFPQPLQEKTPLWPVARHFGIVWRVVVRLGCKLQIVEQTPW